MADDKGGDEELGSMYGGRFDDEEEQGETLTVSFEQDVPMYDYNRLPSASGPPVKFKRRRFDADLKRVITEGQWEEELTRLEAIGHEFLFRFQMLDVAALASVVVGLLLMIITAAAQATTPYYVAIIGVIFFLMGAAEWLTVRKYWVRPKVMPLLYGAWEDEVNKLAETYEGTTWRFVVSDYEKHKKTSKGIKRLHKTVCRIVVRYIGLRSSKRRNNRIATRNPSEYM
uniref:Uncharacterized protein n=1 Tax=Phaeomonas parva TaxID=124430 RepID=A0A7S1U962_9STRA|mmetsp:Transcript_37693/g.117962  ORF Transcript_37693/g.117962 Transcript_37693/m.117962 type:complete len:228 (+) Transcript_37693:149-832(+)|eukprot:CAMPEP_0118880708 /NCGR_PEP_ID=MMETSP1163-20130328/20253_1 /TAXON_ID=124430 /ORGANISM="Phaeomonas parva, Strain CCMP2877" /LENGTH=227 /DNA_ID=CAMNT_0006817217 /DNA_START=325 /DNA_END=1008 /DNA_ORIENTATION=+